MLLTVESYHHASRLTGVDARIVINGEDITDRVVSCDEEFGWALCYRVNSDGVKVIDQATGAPAMDLLEGEVEYRRDDDHPGLDRCASALERIADLLTALVLPTESLASAPRECPHPVDQRVDFSAGGVEEFHCKACGVQVSRPVATWGV